jgi:beta-glucanase (GH16 family)
VRRLALIAALVASTCALAAPSLGQAEKPRHPQSDHRRHHSRKHKRSHHRKAAAADSPAAATPQLAEVPKAATGPAVAPAQAVDPAPAAGEGSAGGEARRLVWADEFNGPAGSAPDPAKWNFDVGGNGWGNEELQYYTARASNASLDGEGDLAITARAEAYRGADGVKRNYTSARLQTLEKMEFTYGQLEARISVPPGKGLAPAFWTLGNEAYEGENGKWPECGEIDAMEILGSEPNVLNGTLHGPWPSAPHGIGSELVHATPLTSGFHTYGVNWEPERISFLLDGSPYAAISRQDLPAGDPWPFQHPNFVLLNLAVGGEWPGSPDAATQFPARMLVDWVRVYQNS